MAVTRSVVLRNGVTVEYWVLQMFHVDFSTMLATASFAGYVDQATYDAGGGKVLESNISANVTGNVQVGTLKLTLETAFTNKVDVES